MINGNFYEIGQLTYKRLEKTYKAIDRALEISAGNPMARLQAGMIKVVLVACPSIKKRTLKNAPIEDVEKAFDRILDTWGFVKRDGASPERGDQVGADTGSEAH